ncbi:MAG: MarR family transcriptional regulator [Clostridia bacterium]|nr:MarR family transcriptional regulator [Clostridia bacterium]
MNYNGNFYNTLGDLSSKVLVLLQSKLVRPNGLHHNSKSKEYFNFMAVDTLIFVALEENGEMTMTQIATKLGVSNQRLTRPVNKLVKNGYLRRIYDENNRRIIKITATQKLKDVSMEYNKTVNDYISYSLQNLSENEVDTLYRDLDEIFGLLNKLK